MKDEVPKLRETRECEWEVVQEFPQSESSGLSGPETDSPKASSVSPLKTCLGPRSPAGAVGVSRHFSGERPHSLHQSFCDSLP